MLSSTMLYIGINYYNTYLRIIILQALWNTRNVVGDWQCTNVQMNLENKVYIQDEYFKLAAI